MKQKILNILCVTTLIITLTMTYFVYVSSSIISYANDSTLTNNKNVEFDAYFKNENNEKTTDKDIASDNLETSLFLYFNVKNEGNLDATIKLENSNFKFKTSESKYVKEIQDNLIKINQIDSSSEVEIEVKIEFSRNQKITYDLLKQESIVTLEAKYINEKSDSFDVNSSKNLKLNLINNITSEDIENNAQIITNKVLEVNGEEKRVLQISVKSGIIQNKFPIKNIILGVIVPEIDGNVPEINYNSRFTDISNTDFEYKDGIAKINMYNEEGKWSTKGNEEIILTYSYPSDISIDNIKIKTVQKVTLFDDTVHNSNQVEINVDKETDGTVILKIQNKENSIYKGKLNYGIDREYKTKTTIQYNLIGVAQNVEIEENEATYEINNQNVNANTYFVQTSMKKSEVEDILGEDGKLEILDENNNILSTIDSTTETDENGIIKNNYNEVKKIKIITTEPKKFGEINIQNEKVIKQTDKNIVKQSSKIIEQLTAKYNNEDIKQTIKNEIILKETKTEAQISINKKQLSTLNSNNVDISAVLKSAKEQEDLYKNPKIEIVLPSEIQEIKVNSINKLYADEFEVKKAILETKEGTGRVITIELQGEQTSYLSELSEGIQLIINADISFNKITPSKQTDLIMKYTNENGIDENYQTEAKVNIMSKYGLFVYSKVSGFDDNNIIENITDETTNINLKEEKIITIERSIINNFELNIENVKILGEIPEIGELVEVSTNVDEAQVSYINNKQYEINIPNNTIVPAQLITIISKIKIKPNLQKQDNYEKLKVNYSYCGEKLNGEYTVNFKNNSITSVKNIKTSQLLKQSNVNGIGELAITATSGGNELVEGAEINEGQTVNAKLVLTNTTGETLNNVKIIAKQENAILYNYKQHQEYNTATESDLMTVTHYEEDESITQREFLTEKLEPGESATFEYEYSVAEKPGEETNGTITISADNKEEQTISALNNTIVDADIKINVKYSENLERKIIAGGVFSTILNIKNIANEDLENITVKMPLQDEIELITEDLPENENFTLTKIENKVAIFNLQSLKSGESENVTITYSVNNFETKEADIKISASATIGEKEYVSNEMTNTAYNLNVNISAIQEGNVKTESVKIGDKIIYTTTIKNNENEVKGIEIEDSIQKELSVEKAYIIKNGEQINIPIEENTKVINYRTEINSNSEIEFILETKIINTGSKSESEDEEENEKIIKNVVGINAFTDYIESNAITYTLDEEDILGDSVDDNNQNEDNTNNNDNNSDNNNSQNQDNTNNSDIGSNSNETQYTNNLISGVVWLDENKDGERTSSEETIDNIEAILLDANNGEIISSTYTDENGYYEFSQINNGRYMVEIKYDSQNYSITEYKKSGISESRNSDIVQKQIDGEDVGLTDVIEVNNNNISNIDAGLIENDTFNLSLNKYITKVIVQNSKGTRVLQYDKEKLAKVEIPARQLAGSIVIVEYNLEMKNEGETPGYASEIIDYIPDDLKFSSEINQNWYLSTDKKIHNISLANEIINPGESKVISLTLTKTMTENNTGVFVNKAEIAKTSNNLAIENVSENDNNEAKILVSIKTGNIRLTILIISIALVILTITAYQLKRKKGDKNE